MISWGTSRRYKVEEVSARAPGEWVEVDRHEDLGDAFKQIRDQQLLMIKGRKLYPDKAEAYDRQYRVVDGRRNRVILWPALSWVMPARSPVAPGGSDHMLDAVAYITTSAQLQQLRRAHVPSSIGGFNHGS